MVDLSYDPRNNFEAPRFDFSLANNVGNGDPFAPSDIRQESGFTDHFNTISTHGGLSIDSLSGPAIYGELTLKGTAQHAPADGQAGTVGNLSYDASIGVKGASLNDGTNPVGYVQGNLTYSSNNAGEWVPPTPDSYELDVYDDNNNVIGTETVTEMIDGYHQVDYDNSDPNRTYSFDVYADTNGAYSISANTADSFTVGTGDNELNINTRGIVGVNDQQGAYIGADASTYMPIDDNWNASLSAGVLFTSKEGSEFAAGAKVSRGIGETTTINGPVTNIFAGIDTSFHSQDGDSQSLSVGINSSLSLGEGDNALALPIGAIASIDDQGHENVFVGVAGFEF